MLEGTPVGGSPIPDFVVGGGRPILDSDASVSERFGTAADVVVFDGTTVVCLMDSAVSAFESFGIPPEMVLAGGRTILGSALVFVVDGGRRSSALSVKMAPASAVDGRTALLLGSRVRPEYCSHSESVSSFVSIPFFA